MPLVIMPSLLVKPSRDYGSVTTVRVGTFASVRRQGAYQILVQRRELALRKILSRVDRRNRVGRARLSAYQGDPTLVCVPPRSPLGNGVSGWLGVVLVLPLRGCQPGQSNQWQI